ncbi:CP family cyanate transporter-like MFS transporter [Isoptericola jiangsuensis]|uniref:CP family cyanate transporter-like MFS transporter n=1 Tax=Isoptericola jiangsuensis TaxID=548579 RepID=A0A2A9F0E1_9MICO|nr:MFS transporter [Isoptericola jiangsuensis]PFG44241.1 CP family cyanate transporter-like MFS transporter [Isoptericola jiangsuensis]
MSSGDDRTPGPTAGRDGDDGARRRAAAGAAGGFVLLALLLASVNLRAHLASLPPVVDDVAASLGLTSAGVGLLTSVPVLCFALFTPAASALTARLGPERAITLGLLGILGGTLLRSTGSVTTAMAGTAVLGVGITIGNVAVPVVIARDFRDRAASVTGAYAATMNAGSTVTTLLTVPLAVAYGWQWALAGWGVLAVLALAAWVPAGRGLAAHHRGEAAGRPQGVAPHAEAGRGTGTAQRRLVVLLTVAFAGQASGYYAMTAWLPSILGDQVGLAPAAAGGGAAPFQLAAVAGAFLVPLALARRVPARAVATTLSLLWIALPVGILAAPDLWWLWVCCAGVAQGGNFTVVMTLLAQRSPTVAAARRGSAVVQTAGYGCAAAAPTALGAVHEATGGWAAPLLVVLALLVAMTVALWAASRPTYLDR